MAVVAGSMAHCVAQTIVTTGTDTWVMGALLPDQAPGITRLRLSLAESYLTLAESDSKLPDATGGASYFTDSSRQQTGLSTWLALRAYY